MKRDWDLIREVLIEVEGLDSFGRIDYQIRQGKPAASDAKAAQAVLLYKAGFLEGIDSSSMEGPGTVARGLTWEGHDLLSTLQSKPVWERVKTIAQQKGIDLTFDAVKALGKVVLDRLISE